jgi:site-specific DNA recombinase
VRRAAIYARISDDASGQGLGVARQIQDCQELVTRLGWELVGVYTDNDVSATRGKVRPEYERLLADIAGGKVDAVAVWASDRLHRRPSELEHFIDLTQQHGTELASVAGKYDLSTTEGRGWTRMLGVVGAMESEKISDRVLRKQRELREAGLPFGGGIRAFGWEADRMTAIPDEFDAIKRMVDLLLSGHSLSAIVRDLNDGGVPTVSQWMATQTRKGDRPSIVGKPWSVTSVRTLLTKPRLAGLLTYRGEVVCPGRWDPVLDRQTFGLVQAALSQRSRGNRAASNTRKYLLSGIATCGACGAGLQSSAHFGGEVDPYRRYRCPASSRNGAGHSGHGGRNMRALDDYVIECLFVVLDLHRLHDPDVEQVDPAPEIERLQARLNLAADQYADDVISAEQLQRISTRLRPQIADLEAQRPPPAAATLFDSYFGTTDPDDARREWDRFDLSQQRMIIAENLGERGWIKVHKAKVLNHGLDKTTIDILWSSGRFPATLAAAKPA